MCAMTHSPSISIPYRFPKYLHTHTHFPAHFTTPLPTRTPHLTHPPSSFSPHHHHLTHTTPASLSTPHTLPCTPLHTHHTPLHTAPPHSLGPRHGSVCLLLCLSLHITCFLFASSHLSCPLLFIMLIGMVAHFSSCTGWKEDGRDIWYHLPLLVVVCVVYMWRSFCCHI